MSCDAKFIRQWNRGLDVRDVTRGKCAACGDLTGTKNCIAGIARCRVYVEGYPSGYWGMFPTGSRLCLIHRVRMESI